MAFTHDNRLLKFTSALGPDVLLVNAIEGAEGLSRLFDFAVDLLADAKATIDPAKIVGTKVTVEIMLHDVVGTRFINGLVAEFEQTSADEEFSSYRARVVPSLWELTLAANCRVFQNMKVMDIIKKVIGTYGLSIGDTTTSPFEPLDYCTQYAETDFNFISRLAEQFGIFYWFEHTAGDNKVVFGDSRNSYSPCPKVHLLSYAPQSGGKEAMYQSVVSDIRATASMVTGKHSARDYDFRPYAAAESGPVSSSQPTGKNKNERYAYPTGEAGYVKDSDKQLTTPKHGKVILTAQGDASDVAANVFHGVSSGRSLLPGFTFTLEDHPRGAWNQAYLLLEVAHHAVQSPPYRSGAEDTPTPYTNRFAAIESERTFRPVAHTPKPRIMGPQTAIVVVPSGEDIFLDKLGRVCVQFFWDRERKDNTIDNTWVRVAQPWAGNGWGTLFWPRAKDEVVVHFLDGDPDNPVVVGSVYNGVNVPRYQLPDMSTRTGIVTRSSKGGAASNANELRFEDKMGSEQIFLNAEKDMDHRIENDSRRFVGGKDSLIVKGDQVESIGGNRHSTVSGNDVEKISGETDLDITTDRSIKVGNNYSLDVGATQANKVGKNYTLNVAQAGYIKTGMTMVIEAGMELTLKAAGGFITIGPAGIAISGPMVMINSGGAAGSGNADDPTAPKPADAPDEADDGTKGGKM